MVVIRAFTQPLSTSCTPQPDTPAIPGRLGAPVRLLCRRYLAGARLRRAAANGAQCRAFFKFKNPLQGDSESAGGAFVLLNTSVFLLEKELCMSFVLLPWGVDFAKYVKRAQPKSS